MELIKLEKVEGYKVRGRVYEKQIDAEAAEMRLRAIDAGGSVNSKIVADFFDAFRDISSKERDGVLTSLKLFHSALVREGM